MSWLRWRLVVTLRVGVTLWVGVTLRVVATLWFSTALAGAMAGAEMARSKHGMVVAGHPEAAEIGLEILKRGGNAMDATVAVSFALGVAEPYGSGLGGKLMMLYRDAASGRVFAVDAMDEAGATFDVPRFLALSPEQRAEGWGGVAVPGLVAGMHAGHRRWGSLPWSDVVRPAAELARTGSLVYEQTRALFERREDRIRVNDEANRIYLPGGHLPEAGCRLLNPDLARTLEEIARRGRDGFYQGWVAESLAGGSQQGGGFLTLDDLSSYRARIIEPLAVDFHGLTVVSAPPPATGGATVLAVLSRLTDVAWRGSDPLDPHNLDQIGQVLRSLYPEIQARIADVSTARESFHQLLDGTLLDGTLFPETPPFESPTLATPPTGTSAETSTTHFVIADARGNVASVTQSLSHHFGSGVVAQGTGVLLNNSLKNFTVDDPTSANFVAPSKRPRSTIAPTLVLQGQTPVLALGVPGGQRIPTATLQVLLDYIVFKTGLAEAIQRPRVHLRRPPWPEEPRNVFQVEQADPRQYMALRQRGWATEMNEDNETFGGFCAIEIRSDRMLVGVADSRRTNAARGY